MMFYQALLPILLAMASGACLAVAVLSIKLKDMK